MAVGMVGIRNCGKCKAPRLLEDFYVQAREPDGAIRLYDSYCRYCRTEGTERSGQRGVSRGATVSAEPFREWLAFRLAQEGLWDLKEWRPIKAGAERGGRSGEELAKDWGTSWKRFTEVLYGNQRTIGLLTVDRILCGAGVSYRLEEMYPFDDGLGLAA